MKVVRINQTGIYEDDELVYSWSYYEEYVDYMTENNLWDEDNEDDEEYL